MFESKALNNVHADWSPIGFDKVLAAVNSIRCGHAKKRIILETLAAGEIVNFEVLKAPRAKVLIRYNYERLLSPQEQER